MNSKSFFSKAQGQLQITSRYLKSTLSLLRVRFEAETGVKIPRGRQDLSEHVQLVLAKFENLGEKKLLRPMNSLRTQVENEWKPILKSLKKPANVIEVESKVVKEDSLN